MKRLKNSLVILLTILSYSFYGQEIITDRPDQTEGSSTIPRGSLQIESGVFIGSVNKNA